VGVTIRVEAALVALRGPAGVLFTNGGTSRAATRWVADHGNPSPGVAAQRESWAVDATTINAEPAECAEQEFRFCGFRESAFAVVGDYPARRRRRAAGRDDVAAAVDRARAVLVLTSSAETVIADHFRCGQEALYAADAVVERVIEDLLMAPD